MQLAPDRSRASVQFSNRLDHSQTKPGSDLSLCLVIFNLFKRLKQSRNLLTGYTSSLVFYRPFQIKFSWFKAARVESRQRRKIFYRILGDPFNLHMDLIAAG